MELFQSNKSMTSVLNLIDLAGSERVGEDDARHNQSEETGFISLAIDGAIHYNITPEELERLLTKEM